MARGGHIRKNDPETQCGKALAEEKRLMDERRRAIERGGGSANERREEMKEYRRRIRQVRADRHEAEERMFGEIERPER